MSAQPPGSRAPTSAAVQADESQYVVLDRQRALRAFDWALFAVVASALVYGLAWGAVELQWGLIAVAIMLGWVIGAAVRHGAWRGQPHPTTRRLQLLAGVFGGLAWLGGAFVAYLVSRALLAESDLSFVQRLEALPFGNYMNQQYEAGGIVHAIGLAAPAIMSWRTAR
jgi:hypothetical protein